MKQPKQLIRVLAALTPAWFGWTTSQALIGWLVFATSASPALVGLAFTLRFAPLTFAGVPAGALSDRFGRLVTLQAGTALAALVALALAVLTTIQLASVFVLLGAAVCFGIVDSGRMVSGTNLVYDLAGDLGPTRAIAISNLVAGIGAALGGAVAGIALSTVGPVLTAIIVAFSYGSAAFLLVGVVETRVDRTRNLTLAAAIGQGLRLLREVPTVGLLITLALVVEIFAFSNLALDPVFAGAVFSAGPIGLGVIVTARAVGRLIGSGVLAIAPSRASLGWFLALAVLAFGLALASYSAAPNLVIAAPIVVIVGVASVWVDALVQTGLQSAVGPTSRGRVAGLWVLIVGLQPVGALELGILAQIAGPRLAQAVNGGIVLAFAVLLLATGPGRRVRDITTSSTL